MNDEGQLALAVLCVCVELVWVDPLPLLSYPVTCMAIEIADFTFTLKKTSRNIGKFLCRIKVGIQNVFS